MRKILFFLCAFVALSSSSAFSEAPVIIVQNQEEFDFWFVVDPEELSGLTSGSPLLTSRVAEFFARQSEQPAFTVLAPEGTTRLEGLPEGAHLLVGFFAAEDLDAFPVRVVSLQADSSIGDRYYAMLDTPALMNVPRGVGRIARFAKAPASVEATPAEISEAPIETAATPAEISEAPIETAAAPAEISEASPETVEVPTEGEPSPQETFEAPIETAAAQPEETEAAGPPQQEAVAAIESAEAAGPLAKFSEAYDPGVFTRESRGEFALLPIADSRSWDQTGLRIAEIDGSIEKDRLRLALTVPNGFSENVSYFLYIFPSRIAGRDNLFTLELRVPPSGSRGACILWQNTAAPPSLLGTVTVSGSTCELAIGFDQVPQELLSEIGDTPTVDLTACWFDQTSETYEEFYYATFSMAGIGVRR